MEGVAGRKEAGALQGGTVSAALEIFASLKTIHRSWKACGASAEPVPAFRVRLSGRPAWLPEEVAE
jgi:hypothetical protein